MKIWNTAITNRKDFIAFSSVQVKKNPGFKTRDQMFFFTYFPSTISLIGCPVAPFGNLIFNKTDKVGAMSVTVV